MATTAKPVGKSGAATSAPRKTSTRTQPTPKPRPTTPHTPATKAERGLLLAVEGNGGYNAAALTETERVVRSAFLRDLLLGKIKGKVVPELGLRTANLIFKERLHLEHLSNNGEPVPQLWLDNAYFAQGLSLSDSNLYLLSLDDSRSDGQVDLERIHTSGNVTLKNLECSGGLVLRSARIGGTLSLNGARLTANSTSEDPTMTTAALSGDGMRVSGNLFCDKSEKGAFRSTGSIRLQGVDVGGQMSFKAAHLTGPETPTGRGDALIAERIRVVDALFLDNGLTVEGRVNLTGATLSDVSISGNLAGRGVVLDLSDAEVRRLRVRLRGSVCRGRIVLEGTRVDTIDPLDPAHWGFTHDDVRGVLQTDFDGLVYRRAEVSSAMPGKRRRSWARFWFKDPVAENVLDLLDSGIGAGAPSRRDYRPQPFEQAAKALREAGYDRAANEVAVGKREFKRACRADGRIAAFMARLSVVFFRYGYGPLRAAMWVASFVILGAWAFSAVEEGGGLVVADAEGDRGAVVDTSLPEGACRLWPARAGVSGCAKAIHDTLGVALNMVEQPLTVGLNAVLGQPKPRPSLPAGVKAARPCPEHAVAFAIDTFLPLVDFGVDKRCRIADDYPRRGLAETFRIFYSIFGWLFIPMAALTFTGVLRKD